MQSVTDSVEIGCRTDQRQIFAVDTVIFSNIIFGKSPTHSFEFQAGLCDTERDQKLILASAEQKLFADNNLGNERN